MCCCPILCLTSANCLSERRREVQEVDAALGTWKIVFEILIILFYISYLKDFVWNCYYLDFIFLICNLAPVVFVDSVNQDISVHSWAKLSMIKQFCQVLSSFVNVYLWGQGGQGRTCSLCGEWSHPPNPNQHENLAIFTIFDFLGGLQNPYNHNP